MLVIDGSIVGRGCMTLMISLVYKQQGLPIVWTVAKRRKGHFPERIHIELMNKVRELIPEGARVVLLGDGEFDGVDLQALVNQCKWEYVLRTSKSARLSWQGEEFRFDDVVTHANPGDLFEVPNALFTQREYGPVLKCLATPPPLMGEVGWGCCASLIFTLPQPLPSREGSFEIDSKPLDTVSTLTTQHPKDHLSRLPLRVIDNVAYLPLNLPAATSACIC